MLDVVEAGEFADPDYLRNPVNRCYFCKANLYDRIAALAEGTIASGANLGDLGDFRPGLTAAAERSVIHPFVEAGIGKPGGPGAGPRRWGWTTSPSFRRSRASPAGSRPG